MTRVVVAEDEVLVLEGVKRILESSGRVEVIAGAGDLDSLRRAVAEHRPDAVVTDVRLPPTHRDEGIRFATGLGESDPEIAVLVLSQHVDPAYVTRLFAGGATRRGYLLKQRIADPGKLVAALEAVVSGELYLDTALVRDLLEADDRRHASLLDGLTPREREILGLMAEGRSNSAIAHELVVTSRAVERHVGAIFQKLRLQDSPEVSRRVMAVLSYLSASEGPAAR